MSQQYQYYLLHYLEIYVNVQHLNQFYGIILHCAVLEMNTHRKPQEIIKNMTMPMGACAILRCDFTHKPSVLYTETGFKVIFVISIVLVTADSLCLSQATP
jgi:hypothetical protein